jgi:hypothetical protein
MLACGILAAGCYGVLGLGEFSFEGDASVTDAGDAGSDSCVDPNRNGCWACTAQTTEQFLNSCGPGGCIPFDAKRLEGLLTADGGLPPLPAVTDGGTE